MCLTAFYTLLLCGVQKLAEPNETFFKHFWRDWDRTCTQLFGEKAGDLGNLFMNLKVRQWSVSWMWPRNP